MILAAQNTYTGATTVNSGGTLQVRHAQALGATSAGTLVQGGVLELAQDLAGQNLLISGESLTLQGGTLRNLGGQNVWQGPITLNGSNIISAAAGSSLTLNGQFTGSGNITKIDSGCLVLEVASGSTYSGGALNVAGGTLQVLGAGALRPAKFHNTSNNRAGATVEIGGSGSQPQLLIQQFFHLGNDANAPITVNQHSGTVANAGTANQPSVSDMSKLANVWGGATNGTGNTSPVVYNLRGGTLDLRAAPLYLSWKADATLNIEGGTALLQGLVLGYETRDAFATVNLRSGDLYLASGGIRADAASQPFSRKQVNLYGGTLGALHTWSYNNMNLHLLGPATIDTDDDYQITMTGQLLNPGSGMITKIGAGTLYLNGDIQIDPQTQLDIEEGKVVINGVAYGSCPSNPLIVTGTLTLIDWGFGDPQLQNLPRSARWLVVRGGRIRMEPYPSGQTDPDGRPDYTEAPRAFTLDRPGATLEAAAGVTWRISVYPRADGSDRYPLVSNLAAGQNLTLTGAGTGQIDKVIPGAGGLLKTGSGTWILTGDNTYTGTTTVSQGVLEIRHANALGATGTNQGTTVSSDATLRLAVPEGTPGITFAAEPLSLAGSGVGGVGALQNAAGTNTWTGAVTLTANTSIGVAGGSQLTISGGIGQSGGTRSLTKLGSGTLVLADANTYTGGTTVTAGKLLVNNTSGSGTGSGAVTVGNQAVLGGTGSIAGDVTIQSGGLLTAGDVGASLGDNSLAIGGNLTMQSGSTWVVDIFSSSSWDLIDLSVTGKTASFPGPSGSTTLTVNVLGSFVPSSDNPITILKAANITGITIGADGIPTAGIVFNPTGPGSPYSNWRLAIVSLADGRYGLNLWAAPEPSTWLMLLVGGAGLGLLRWYRRRSAGQNR